MQSKNVTQKLSQSGQVDQVTRIFIEYYLVKIDSLASIPDPLKEEVKTELRKARTTGKVSKHVYNQLQAIKDALYQQVYPTTISSTQESIPSERVLSDETMALMAQADEFMIAAEGYEAADITYEDYKRTSESDGK